MTSAATLSREQAKAKRSALESALLLQLRAAGLTTGMVQEFRPFADTRHRFDFAWPHQDPRVCVEVEGGVYSGGRHTRGAGFTADAAKYNRAATQGWYVLRVTAEHIKSGQALAWIQQMVQR